MTGWLLALGGAAAGTAQAGLLSLAARARPAPVAVLARLLLAGSVLFLAARSGHLALGAAGWLAGFAAAGVVLHRRLR